ncbi:MAG: hypothetical protein D6737_08395 [Chloroflexi bacterium]|nr:MAG: hypothetical protein D6737_08395 [Chloroflexota bacterium]
MDERIIRFERIGRFANGRAIYMVISHTNGAHANDENDCDELPTFFTAKVTVDPEQHEHLLVEIIEKSKY